jgi:uncharacterized membrane protein YhaH (DUF805 family)
LVAGITLGVIKYAIESLGVWLMTGEWFSPVEFVNPWLSSKAPFLVDSPMIGLAWLLFTIPFVWIAIAMSVRRAADIGISPWIGLLMLVPLVNLAIILLLAVLPTGLVLSDLRQSREDAQRNRQISQAFQPSNVENATEFTTRSTFGAALLAIGMGCVTQTGVGMVSVWVLQVYGFILFFSAPVVAGAVAGFIYNFRERNSFWKTVLVILLMNIVSFVVMLLVGLDGAVCLIMAFPLLGPLSFAGGLIGATLATAGLRPGVDERRGMVGTMVIFPFCLALEPFDNTSPMYHVTTSVDIAAAPEVIWQQVIAFPEIEAPLEWYFRLGIAAPMRASIDGHGVGAIRHCEFTTGEFVEPITAWEPPTRLAFDVTSQPAPIHEWTPYLHLHPPHLDTGFVSRRGEFRVERLPTGMTRLHGTTWYELDVRPRLYWQSLANPVIHSIHRRVLEQIAAGCERDVGRGSQSNR